jgi:large subunit ribosomal protein L18
MYAQVIDEEAQNSLAAASTVDQELRDKEQGLNKTEQARLVGKLVAERAMSKGVTKVVFDRGGYQYIGRVKALAEEARKAGLDF